MLPKSMIRSLSKNECNGSFNQFQPGSTSFHQFPPVLGEEPVATWTHLESWNPGILESWNPPISNILEQTL